MGLCFFLHKTINIVLQILVNIDVGDGLLAHLGPNHYLKHC